MVDVVIQKGIPTICQADEISEEAELLAIEVDNEAPMAEWDCFDGIDDRYLNVLMKMIKDYSPKRQE